MPVRNNIVIIVLLFIGLFGIQLFFILRTWDHEAIKLDSQLESIIGDVYQAAVNDSSFYAALQEVVLHNSPQSIAQLNTQLNSFEVSESFNSDDISFEVFRNKFSNNPGDFILNNVSYTTENFQLLKAHHLCLSCVLENRYENRESYLEFGVIINNKPSLQFAALWFPMFLSLLFLLLLSAFSIVVLRKWTHARQLNIQKNGFINNLSHELKTPIFSIKLLSQLVIEKSKDDTLNEYGSRIKLEADHLDKHIHRILESTGLESGYLVRFSPIELQSFLKGMSPSIKMLCENSCADYEYTSTHSSEAHIIADVIHLKNVVNALVDNAIKYGGEKPKITIELLAKGTHYVINISDNGIGIPESERRNVLEKFFRLNMDDSNSVPGFGLGLYYANEAMRQMNGSLEIHDGNVRGTTISLSFKADVQ